MKETMKRNRKFLIIASLIILAPMVVGMLLWNRLPDTLPTHFTFSGEADQWSSKAFAVFFLPLFLLVIQFACLFGMSADPRRANISDRMLHLALLICPAVSLFAGILIYGNALSLNVNAGLLGRLFAALLFLVIGNYLPKCRQNYTMGIKLPWTLHDAENWNRTHRMAGRLWVVLSIIVLIDAFFQRLSGAMLLGMLLLAVLAPTLYSYLYFVRHHQDR